MAASGDKNWSDYKGPTLEDCQRLWDTLTGDFIVDLQVRLQLQAPKDPRFRPRIQLWSPGLDPETGGMREHIWATKELQAAFEAVTYRQLYDLLIVGYRKIELFFDDQQPLLLP